MVTVEKLDESNKELFIKQVRTDVIRHVFAFYDVQHDPQHTTIHACFRNSSLLGYILLYTATDVPSVILECEENIAETLIAFAPENHFVIHSPPSLLPIVKRRFSDAKSYVENWMLVRKENAKFISSTLVRRLSSKKDASMFAKLVLNRKDRPKRNLKIYVDWIAKMPIYGVFEGDDIVSYAGSFIQTPQIWMIGGVYTDPDHRNKGYASLATSAVTEEALQKAEMAALFVRSDNYSAIRVYEKIGYQKIGEKLWVDVGTGLKP
jgi:ribosomal protein S18 acetylase RimI-like enzyme